MDARSGDVCQLNVLALLRCCSKGEAERSFPSSEDDVDTDDLDDNVDGDGVLMEREVREANSTGVESLTRGVGLWRLDGRRDIQCGSGL